MLPLITRILHLVIGFLAISFVLLIHELGHYLTARLLDVEVETFSIGMGPRLFTHHGRKCDLCISLIPFGAYCQIKGNADLTKALRDGERSFRRSESGSYFAISPIFRVFIYLAGPLSNLLLSCLLFIIIGVLPVEMIANEARVVPAADYPLLFDGAPVQEAIEKGDLILKLDGIGIGSYEEAEEYLSMHNSESVDAIILRGDEELEVTLTPIDGSFGIALFLPPVVGRCDEAGPFRTGDRILTVDGQQVDNSLDFLSLCSDLSIVEVFREGERVSFTYHGSTYFPFAFQERIEIRREQSGRSAIIQGAIKCHEFFLSTLDSLVKVVSGRSEDARNEITGPARAAQTIGSITALGFSTSFTSGLRALLYLTAIVSISICIANLLPIPSFDGGQMALNLYQAVTGKEAGPRFYLIFQLSGIVISVIIIASMYALDIRHYLAL